MRLWILPFAAGCPWIPPADHFGRELEVRPPSVDGGATEEPSGPSDSEPAGGSTPAPPVTGAGTREQTLEPSVPFTALLNETPADVIVATGLVGSVAVSCPEGFAGDLVGPPGSGPVAFVVAVVGGELRIETGVPDPALGFGTCAITVVAPELAAVEAADSGDLVLTGRWFDLASIRACDSGDIEVTAVEVASLLVEIEGSGDVWVGDGSAEAVDIHVADSGDVVAGGIVADEASILSEGSGDVALTVTGTATVTITDSGDVVLTGDPTVFLDDTGSGDLVTP